MAEGGGVLSIDPAVLLLQVAGFVLLFLLLRRYLFRPLLGLMEQREQEIADGLEAGERAKERLAHVEEERGQLLVEAREQGREEVRRSVQEGERARERIVTEAREEAEDLRRRARDAVELEGEQAMIDLRQKVVDLALLAAKRSVLGRIDEEQHRQVVDDFIAGLEQEQ